MGKRRYSRELALQFLYQYDLNRGDLDGQIESFWENADNNEEIKSFAMDLIKLTLEHQTEIDEMIGKCSDNWTLSRMAAIDRNILRLGVCELSFYKRTPPKVAIDEAVEIAKKYGGDNSPDFVNGILDRLKSGKLKAVADSLGK